MFLDKKTLLKIWLNPGLNLTIFRVTGPRNTSSRNPDSHEVPMTNEIKWEKKVPIKKTGIQYLESRIHNVKSGIQDCHGFPRTGETKGQETKYIFTGSLTSSARVSHVMSHAFMFFFWTKPSWLWFFSTSWTITARQTMAIRPSRNCANYKKLICCKGTLATEFHPLKRVQGQVFEKFC